MLHGRLTFRCITESAKGDISSDDVVCVVTFDFHPRQHTEVHQFHPSPAFPFHFMPAGKHRSSPFSAPYLVDKFDLNPSKVLW